MKVINLLAGPGTGKSTTAAGIFHKMKLAEVKIELVTEYIKSMAYEKRHSVFEDQIYVFAKQHRRMWILRKEVDWVVTDSPLILSGVYAPKNYFKTFNLLVLEAFDHYENFNFFLTREKPYKSYGRGQTATEAIDIDQRVLDFMAKHNIPYVTVKGDEKAAAVIYRKVMKM